MIKDKVIKKIVTSLGVDGNLLERHLSALDFAKKIQNFDKKMYLFGGTAAQFFLPYNMQRTSVDVDLITNYSYDEIEEIIKDFCRNNSIDPKRLRSRQLKNVYGRGFNFPMKFRYSSPRLSATKIEVVSKPEEKFRIIRPATCKFYGVDFGQFRILNKIDIFAKKMVMLDLDGIGLSRNRVTEIGKQIYDLKRLYDSITLREVNGIGNTIRTQFDNDIDKKKHNCTVDDCISNACNFLQSLSLLGSRQRIPDTDLIKKSYKNAKTFIPLKARIDPLEWSSLGWTFEHLLRSISGDASQDDVLDHFKARDKFRKTSKENEGQRADLIKELLDRKVPKPVRKKPLEALHFKYELTEGST